MVKNPKKEKETYYKGKGVKVIIKFKRSSPYGRRQSTYRNVTEIHKNYNNSGKIAFESDIHTTGITQEIKHIESIKITKEKLKSNDF